MSELLNSYNHNDLHQLLEIFDGILSSWSQEMVWNGLDVNLHLDHFNCQLAFSKCIIAIGIWPFKVLMVDLARWVSEGNPRGVRTREAGGAEYSTNQEILGLKLRIAKVCPSFVWVAAGFEPSLLCGLIISLIYFTQLKEVFCHIWFGLSWVVAQFNMGFIQV